MIDVITFADVAQGATLSSPDLAAGDSFTVLSDKGLPRIKFVAAIGETSTGVAPLRIRITSPDMHDISSGLDLNFGSGTTNGRSGFKIFEPALPLRKNTDLTVQVTSGTGAGENSIYMIGMQYDPVLPPPTGVLDYVSRRQTITGGAGDTPAYSATLVRLDSADDLKKNMDYCILGYTTEEVQAYIRFTSTSFNGLKPGGIVGLGDDFANQTNLNQVTADWFARLGDCPRFNSNSGVDQALVSLVGAAASDVHVNLATKLTRPLD